MSKRGLAAAAGSVAAAGSGAAPAASAAGGRRFRLLTGAQQQGQQGQGQQPAGLQQAAGCSNIGAQVVSAGHVVLRSEGLNGT